MTRWIKFSALVLAATGLPGCARVAPERGSPPFPPPAAVQPGVSGSLAVPEIVDARKLYASKCARCHKFYDPLDYGEAEWRAWMRKMTKKARLKPDQAELLTRYLEAVRGRNP